MNHYHSLFLLILAFVVPQWDITSQSSIRVAGQSMDSIGYNTLTGKKVVGKRISFDANIYYAYIDSANQDILLQLRHTTKNGKFYKPKGEIVAINPRNVGIKWRRSVNYSKSLINNQSKYIIEQQRKKNICVDMRTGKDLWEVKSNILQVFSDIEIGIGYNADNRKKNSVDLQGIDMTSGMILWNREVDRNYGWREWHRIDSTTVLVSASGIHTVDLKTGKGWSYHEKSGKTRYNFWTDTNTLYNISSNTIIDSTSIYYASSNALISFDKEGNEIWAHEFEKGVLSKSYILFQDEKIIMMNTGMVNSTNGIDKPYGRPFIASIDKHTGMVDFINYIETDKKNWLTGLKIIDDRMYTGFKKNVRIYDLKDGTLQKSIEVDENVIGEIRSTISSLAYLPTADGGYMNMYEIEDQEVFFLGDKGVVFGVDENLKLSGMKNLSELYLHYNTIDEMIFIAKENHTVVLSQEGVKMFELALSRGTERLYQDIYNVQEKDLIILDWNQFK